MNSLKFLYQFCQTFYPLLLIVLSFLLNLLTLPQILLGYLLYCIYTQLITSTELRYTPTKYNSLLLSMCPSLRSPVFKPHFLLPMGFQQMLAVAVLKVPNSQHLSFTKQQINAGGVNLFWASLSDPSIPKPSSDTPVLIIFPGMTGNIGDPYVVNLVMEGIKNRFNVCVYQFRLISAECMLPEDGKFTLYGDIDDALDKIRESHQGEIYAIGGSYGANNLVYYLGYCNRNVKKIKAAVSISNPYDMLICERMAEDTIFETLITHLEKDNFKKIRKNVEKCKNSNVNVEFVANCDVMKAYDEEFTRKVLGYKSADDYYRSISAVNQIANVDIPLLCISARDDGMTSSMAIPFDDLRLNDNILLIVSDKGAHMCFVDNKNFFQMNHQWLMKPVFEFLNANVRIHKENLSEVVTY